MDKLENKSNNLLFLDYFLLQLARESFLNSLMLLRPEDREAQIMEFHRDMGHMLSLEDAENL